MAEIDTSAPPRFGAELKDAFKPVNTWVSNGITWLDDIQQFYRERSVIEKEYSAKLNALAKKYFEKKAKKSSSLSVGDTPTVTPGSLESASLTIWTTQLNTLESRASEHDRFGSELVSQLADPLRQLSGRYEEIRKRHADYATKLEKKRDSAYADLRKTKVNYDGACQEVESRRKKIESSFDYNKQKAQNAYQQQVLNMHNVKNTYIVSINVTNKQKENYYHEHNVAPWQEPPDMAFEPSPVWHDDSAMIVDQNAKIFLTNIMGKSKAQLGDLRREAEKKRKEVENVQRIRKAIREGRDKRDEVELATATFALQEELHRLDHKRLTAEIEVSTIESAVGDVTLGAKNHDFRSQTFKIPTNCDLCRERIWGLSAKGFDCKDCGYTCHSKCELKVPATCPGEQTKEEKKKLKGERQGGTHDIHSAAEGPPHSAKSEISSLSRSDTVNTMNSGYSASAHRLVAGNGERLSSEEGNGEAQTGTIQPTSLRKNRVVAPPPSQYVSELPSDGMRGRGLAAARPMEKKGRMIYEYCSNGEGEITVQEGTEVVVLDLDDGSGWMTVRSGGIEGIVPATYVELLSTHSAPIERPPSVYSNSSASLTSSATGAGKKKGPAVAPKRGAKKLKYVEALYDYEARSDAEWSMREGEKFVLVTKDSGDGWADVEKGGTVRSVPANYIQETG
ncbi:MAG: hypothetical protein M1817_005985 [Caeruleum heppii]|nr:MAG: hypothetical protein M1817_005985 [Caeruleum heppii]